MHPTVIVLGNEKGGTGKSTVCMHIIISLLKHGFKVGSVDVDARQGTLSRYIENRRMRSQAGSIPIELPDHVPIFRSETYSSDTERETFVKVLEQFQSYHYVVIDTPGSDNFLSRLAHSYADMLITPMNDSFVDLDLLVRVNPDFTIIKPSTYAEMVWEQKKEKAKRGERGTIDWIVLRNRLSGIYSRNKEEMERVLQALSKRIGFRIFPGFGERVIFRELFLSGLTLLDMRDHNVPMSLSHVAAKQELADLMKMILES